MAIVGFLMCCALATGLVMWLVPYGRWDALDTEASSSDEVLLVSVGDSITVGNETRIHFQSNPGGGNYPMDLRQLLAAHPPWAHNATPALASYNFGSGGKAAKRGSYSSTFEYIMARALLHDALAVVPDDHGSLRHAHPFASLSSRPNRAGPVVHAIPGARCVKRTVVLLAMLGTNDCSMDPACAGTCVEGSDPWAGFAREYAETLGGLLPTRSLVVDNRPAVEAATTALSCSSRWARRMGFWASTQGYLTFLL